MPPPSRIATILAAGAAVATIAALLALGVSSGAFVCPECAGKEGMLSRATIDRDAHDLAELEKGAAEGESAL